MAVFLLALLVRLAPLGRYVTPDEPIWVLRSVRFADALAAGDVTAIPQTGHPGLTTMALGALGVRVTAALRPAASAAHLAWLRNVTWLAPENHAAFPHLVFFLPAGRALVAATTALGVALAYWLARPRLGMPAAGLLALFLALDPFFGGLAGLLHTDALQATFALLALLLVLPPRDSYPAHALPLAALCLALAGLTKTLGLLVAPGIALAMLLGGRDSLTRRALRVAALAALTLALTLALYPPFWHDPPGALETLLGAARYHEGIGRRAVFFAGEFTTSPGIGFYPAVLLFRLTPPVLVGLALALRDRLRGAGTAPAPRWFALPALLYLGVLATADKAFDRYALSAMVLLAPVAAQAWAARRLPRARGALLAALLLPWALVAPLPLYYADPLVGGPWLARHVVPLGWGESAGLAAQTAARHLPAPERGTLLTHNVPGAAGFFPGAVWPWDATRAPCADALAGDAQLPTTAPQTTGHRIAGHRITGHRIAGLHLITVHTQTLPLPTGPLLVPGPLPGAPAAAVVPVADLPALRQHLAQRYPPGAAFTRVRAPACYPLAEAQLDALFAAAPVTCVPDADVGGLATERCTFEGPLPPAAPFDARVGGALDLLAAAWPDAVRAPDALPVRLRWRAMTPLADLSVYLALRDGAGDLVWAEGGSALLDDRAWPTSAWDVGTPVEGTAYVPLPLHLPPGTYTLTLSLADATGAWLGLSRPDGSFGGIRRELGAVRVAPPPYPAPELPGLTPLTVERPGVHLVGVGGPPAEVLEGARLPFQLGWLRTTGPVPNTLRWTLRCDDATVDGGRLPLGPGDPNAWPSGHRYLTRYAPRTAPTSAPPQAQACSLSVRVGDTDAVELGTLGVRPRPRQFAFPEPPDAPLEVAVGDWAQWVGVDAPSTVAPGTPFEVTLYLRAQGAAPRAYTIFVHVEGPEGRVWAQSDAVPQGGAAPTTTWVTGQAIVDTHTLALPADAPAGTYRVFVGLYDAARGPRARLYGAAGQRLPDDRAPVWELLVAP
jgi:hypothetical protein